MAKTFIYVGPTVNLGRFGLVRKGDPISLSPKESDSINRDKRFVVAKVGEVEAWNKTVDEKKLPDSQVPSFVIANGEEVSLQGAARDKWIEQELCRRERLKEQNDMHTVYLVELEEMEQDQLLAKASELKREGYPIEFKANMNKKILLKIIKNALAEKGELQPQEEED